MKTEKFKSSGDKYITFYSAPAGWLTKHLDKNGPEKIFDGTNRLVLKREKK
jgi:hypothetical protein